MARVQTRAIDTGTLKLDVTYAYNVEKRQWIKFVHPGSKSPTDRQNRVPFSNCALQVNVPTSVTDVYDITLIGTGLDTNDPIFTREILGAKNNQLLRSLPHKTVNRVLLPSLHFLHAGGLIVYNNRGDAEPICPNAEYIIPRGEWDAAMGNNRYHQNSYREVRQNLKKLEKLGVPITLVDDIEAEVGPGIVMECHGGVTPANSTVSINCGSEKLVVSPLLFPSQFHIDPFVQFGFSEHQSKAYEAKYNLLERAERERSTLFFAMDPLRTAVYIDRDRDGNFVGTPSDILSQHDPFVN